MDWGDLIVSTAKNLLKSKGADTKAPTYKPSNLERFMKGKSTGVNLGAAIDTAQSARSTFLAGLWQKFLGKSMDQSAANLKAFQKLTGINIKK